MDPAEPDLTEPDPAAPDLDALDLDAVERDLAGVEAAMARLDAGTAFTCVVCGGPIEEARLAASPLSDRCSEQCAGSDAA
jgi:RNA polymerase-binding transcription factor DksA